MGKRRRIWLGVLLLAVLGGGIWFLTRPQEPVYQGKPLSFWLGECTSHERNSPRVADATNALRHIGTNALPTLLQMLQERDSGLKTSVVDLLDRQKLVKFNFSAAADENLEASMAFGLLGADASNAVPALVRIYESKISPGSVVESISSLGWIGPPAAGAIPSLVRGLSSTNAEERWTSAWALGKIHGEPELVVPELVKHLQDPHRVVREFLVAALGEFGTNARPVVPALLPMLNDQFGNVRREATNALKEIDPEAAARAGVK